MTDNVYMVHAIRALAASFPTLAAPDAAAELTINIRIYKYAKTSTEHILGIHGGSGDLHNFLQLYSKEAKKFTPAAWKHPVLVLIDNDFGANNIFKYIAAIKKVPVTRNEPFLHVTHNLYVVPTPLNGAAESKIEDFLPESVKDEKVEGKPFDADKDHGDETAYGKVVFAHEVVRPKADSIDFSAFAPLLANITAAIAAHAAALGAVATPASPSGPPTGP